MPTPLMQSLYKEYKKGTLQKNCNMPFLYSFIFVQKAFSIPHGLYEVGGVLWNLVVA